MGRFSRAGWALALICAVSLFGALWPAVGEARLTATAWDANDVLVNDPEDTFGGPHRGVREPVVAIDPTNPNRILAAAMDQNFSNTHNFGTWAAAVHIYRSSDGGAMWKDGGLIRPPGKRGVWSSGDPSLAFDNDGTVWLAVLSDRLARSEGSLGVYYSERGGIYVYRSNDGGKTWTRARQAAARLVDEEGGHCAGTDKEHIGVDHRTGELLVAYTLFHNNCPRNQVAAYHSLIEEHFDVEIMLVRSRDGGRTWSEPERIWHGYALGAQPVVGPDGTIYVAFSASAPPGAEAACPSWFDSVVEKRPAWLQLVVASSTDGGATWRYEERSFCDPGLHPSEQATAGARIPSISVDQTDGRAYVVWPSFLSAPLVGPFFGIDTMTSDDGGRSWSPTRQITPLQIGDSVMPAVTAECGVARSIWMTTPDRGETFDVFAADSSDGGATWSGPQRISSATSAGGGELYDYIWVDVAGGRIAAIWTDMRAGNRTNVYARTGSAACSDGPARDAEARDSGETASVVPVTGDTAVGASACDLSRSLMLPGTTVEDSGVRRGQLALSLTSGRSIEDLYESYRAAITRAGYDIVLADFEGFEAELFFATESGEHGLVRLYTFSSGSAVSAGIPVGDAPVTDCS